VAAEQGGREEAQQARLQLELERSSRETAEGNAVQLRCAAAW
jgi:hypothetical protein